MRRAHLIIVIIICTVPFLPLHVILKYKLYLTYIGLVTLWLVVGKCPMTHTDDTPEEDVKYRPSFVHKLFRIVFPDMSLHTFQNIADFIIVGLLSVVTVRIAHQLQSCTIE